MRMAWQHIKQADNQQLLKGLLYQYGAPAAVGLSCLLPMGWLVGIAAAIPSHFIAKRGGKIIDALNLDTKSGPLPIIARMQQIWTGNEANTPTKLMGKFNQLLDELLPDNPQKIGDQAAVLREKLKMTEQSKLFRLLDRAFNTRNRGITGFIVRKLDGLANSRVIRLIPPLRLPLKGLSMGLLGLFMLVGQSSVRQGVKRAVTRMG